MKSLENHLKTLSSQEKRALADWLWRAAESEAELTDSQTALLERRAVDALSDAGKRFPLGDAEKKLRR